MTDETPAPEAEPEISSIEFTPAEVVPWLCQVQVGDGEIFIHDLDQYVALTQAVASRNLDGHLCVLKLAEGDPTGSLSWVSVEDLNKKPKSSPLRSIKAVKT